MQLSSQHLCLQPVSVLYLDFFTQCFTVSWLIYSETQILKKKPHYFPKKRDALFISTPIKSSIVLKRHWLQFGKVLIDCVATGDSEGILADSEISPGTAE